MRTFGFDGPASSSSRMARSSAKSRATRGEISYAGIASNNASRSTFCSSNIAMC